MHYILIRLLIFNQWYTPYGGRNEGKTIFRLNTVILTKVKVQYINDVALPTRSSSKLRCDSIRMGAVYVCGAIHDEILEAIFSKEELNKMN